MSIRAAAVWAVILSAAMAVGVTVGVNIAVDCFRIRGLM